MDSKAVARSFSIVGFMVFGVAMLREGFAWLFSKLFEDTGNAYLTVLLPIVLLYVIAIPIMWQVVKANVKANTISSQTPEKYKIPAGTLVAWFLIVLAVTRLVSMVVPMAINAVSGKVFEDPVTSLQLESPWMMFFLVVLVAPVAEETIFRGFLYKVLAPYGAKFFVLTSAILFSLFHENIGQIPSTFLLGVFFACVMYRTGDVRITILLHFINNLISGIAMLFFGSETGKMAAGVVVLVLIAVGIVVGIVWLATKRAKRDVFFDPAPVVPARAGNAFGNIGIILVVAALIALTIVVMMNSM